MLLEFMSALWAFKPLVPAPNNKVGVFSVTAIDRWYKRRTPYPIRHQYGNGEVKQQHQIPKLQSGGSPGIKPK